MAMVTWKDQTGFGGGALIQEQTIKELEKNERIDKNLLRYVTIRVKKFDLKENYFGKEEIEETKKGKKKLDEK